MSIGSLRASEKLCLILCNHRVYPLNFNIFPWIFHGFSITKALKLRTFNHSQCSSHSTGRCGRHQNMIWLHKCILVWKCWMTERNNAISWKDAFQFPWLFMDFPKPGVNFHDFSRPGKKNNGIPWLFHFFCDWIYPVIRQVRALVSLQSWFRDLQANAVVLSP